MNSEYFSSIKREKEELSNQLKEKTLQNNIEITKLKKQLRDYLY